MKLLTQRNILASIVAVAAVISPSLLSAKCPTKDDLKSGVTFTRASPFLSELVIQIGNGIKAHRIMTSKGERVEIISSYTHPLAVEERRSSTEVLSISYDKDPNELTNLKSSENWSSNIKFYRNSELFSEGEFEVELTGTSSVSVKDCTYKTLMVETTLTFDKGGAPIRYRKEYAPKLNWVLKDIRLARSGIPISQTSYDKITVGKLR
ncbi:hypothetical protein GUA87_00460 [Sneathiella sp. P13V-1]|uniref:hypothetical protein n=1 Tax=Sneathiella sp. P13V-1 TaxID=2697366 RepID=UPI00187B3B0B|nr:hypothetical protein [Sneathiella sp. P13V-1]MBE7635299.1 hypothetical protein [Sneathiella sp. P13V-1]